MQEVKHSHINCCAKVTYFIFSRPFLIENFSYLTRFNALTPQIGLDGCFLVAPLTSCIEVNTPRRSQR